MASVTITRNFADPVTARVFERVQRRLKAGSRPIDPVVSHFAKEWKRRIDFDFRVGGTSPFVWAPNARNTIAAKGHSRQLEGKNGPKLRDSIRIVTNSGTTQTRYKIAAWVPAIGEYNQTGTKPYTITPKKPGGMLRFVVAEDKDEFTARRRRALTKRRAGSRVKIPARPGKVVVFARSVKHPGIPARRFIVVREGLIREAWRKPLRAFLFEGKVPS